MHFLQVNFVSEKVEWQQITGTLTKNVLKEIRCISWTKSNKGKKIVEDMSNGTDSEDRPAVWHSWVWPDRKSASFDLDSG